MQVEGRAYPLLDGSVVAQYDKLSPDIAKSLNSQANTKDVEYMQDAEDSVPLLDNDEEYEEPSDVAEVNVSDVDGGMESKMAIKELEAKLITILNDQKEIDR
ncbi:hypothetical protein SK128_017758, partial [Halocaridina rubra]